MRKSVKICLTYPTEMPVDEEINIEEASTSLLLN